MARFCKLPVDVVALVAALVAVVAVRLPAMRHGMSFGEPSVYFHLGHRALDGAMPYRDYVFHLGPLPIYVDAAVQAGFGSTYIASLVAGLAITALRVLVIWMLARRLAGIAPALLLAVFCTVDPMFAAAHPTALAYTELLLATTGLFFVLATRAERELGWLALAGTCTSLILAVDPRSAVAACLVMFAVTTGLLARKQWFTPRRYLAVWVGVAGGFVVVLAALAATGVLAPALDQMLVDTPGLDPSLERAIAQPAASWRGGLVLFVAVRAAIVAGTVYLATRERISSATLGLLAVPIGCLVALALRYAVLDLTTDVPRMFLLSVAVIAIVAPARVSAWFGIEPLVAVALAALPLASDWALDLELPGRTPGDPASLVVGGILIALASKALAARAKTWICAALAVAAAIHVGVAIYDANNPYGTDGTLDETTASSSNRRLRGLRISESRLRALDWLQHAVRVGSTCFVYGDAPVLYTLLRCRNPTRLDLISNATDDDLGEAIAVLESHPPDVLIVQEQLPVDPALHAALHRLLPAYADRGVVAVDGGIRVYRRSRDR